MQVRQVKREMFKNIFLSFIGLSTGALVAAGLFAFITKIGVVTRFAARTKTAKYVMVYEDMVVLGGTVGNLFSFFEWNIPGGNFIISLFGLFTGIFVGCLAISLAETLNVIPIFTRRIYLKKGLKYIILSIALGKFSGTLYQLYFNWKI